MCLRIFLKHNQQHLHCYLWRRSLSEYLNLRWWKPSKRRWMQFSMCHRAKPLLCGKCRRSISLLQLFQELPELYLSYQLFELRYTLLPGQHYSLLYRQLQSGYWKLYQLHWCGHCYLYSVCLRILVKHNKQYLYCNLWRWYSRKYLDLRWWKPSKWRWVQFSLCHITKSLLCRKYRKSFSLL